MGTRIEIEPGYEDALAAAGLRTFDDFLNVKAGAPVSKHRHRETVPIEIAVGGTTKKFFLKRVFQVPPAHVIWPLFGLRKPTSQPAHEWRVCEAMKKAGLPAMERVATGERRVFGIPTQAFILLAATPFQHTLDDWLTPGFERPRVLSANERIDLLREVALLGKRICECNFNWPDANAKHIFAEPMKLADKTKWEFCLIDLERAHKEKPDDSWVVTIRQIFRSMNPLRLSEMELTAVSEALGIEVKGLTWDLESEMLFGNGTLNDDGLGLAHDFVHPRRLHMLKINDIHVNPSFAAPLQRAGIESVDSIFSLRAGEFLTKAGLASHRDRIRLQLDHGVGRLRSAYLKRFRQAPLKEQFRRTWYGGFKRSHARLESKYARRLTEAGVGTLTTIAWGHEMHWGWERRSFLITDEIPGESLEKLAGRIASGALTVSAKEKFEIIRQLAMITRRMHGEGLFHRDFYLCHIFHSRDPDGRPILRVIDLGRMIESYIECGRWMIKDLAALDYSSPRTLVTRADRVRFLYHYLSGLAERTQMTEQEERSCRGIVKDVVRRNRKTAAHDAKRAARHQRSQTAT